MTNPKNIENSRRAFAVDPKQLDAIAAAGRAVYGLLEAKKITLKAARANSLYIKASDHNKKLKKTARDHWYIFNLPAVITCPGATPDCIKYCYARKAEKMYPSANKRRAINFITAVQAEFAERMIYTLYVELYAAEKRGARLNVRIHESGDFFSREYLEKWLTVAAELNTVVSFWNYTKSFDFIYSPAEAAAINSRGSVWADTKPADVEKIAALNMPIYTAYAEEEIARRRAAGEKFFKCRCADCSNCRACINSNVKTIICAIH